MSLFKRDFSKAGPGVAKDEPRKVGVARFFEIVAREYRDLMKINVWFFVCVFPSIGMFFLGLLGIFEFALMLSIIAAYPIGGAYSASMFCMTRMLRDDPGFVWEDFKRKFKENLRQAGLAGLIVAMFIYTQVFLFWLPLMADWAFVTSPWIIFGLLMFLLFTMVTPYVFMHYAYIKLPTFKIIKNSTLLALSNFGRSFAGAIFGLLPWLALIFLLPNALLFYPLIPFIGFVFSWLMTLSWIWPVFNKHFAIEETLIKEQQEKLRISAVNKARSDATTEEEA